MAGDLYHGLDEWAAAGNVSRDGITPGRIGHVFFSPKAALKALEGRPPKWRNNTYSGLWPNLAAASMIRSMITELVA